MKRICPALAFIAVLVFSVLNGTAQNDDRTLLKKVVKENQNAVYAIAMYPTETRKIIFQATEYPEIIAKLNGMQTTSQDAFAKLVSPLSKDEQDKIWNMTRYDGLIADLAAEPGLSDEAINTIVVNYPEEIQKTAAEEVRSNYDLLVQIDKMNQNYNSDFELLLSTYPPDVINTFREMIKMPEVLDILYDHMQYTVVVGDYYKKNPERVLHKTDSINQVLTQKSTQQADDWKQSMTNDPQVEEEYTQAAQDYAQYNGYNPDDYTAPLTPDVTNYNANPYNWWFGYPTWYPYNYWNPYPYWYDWGFYYGPNHQVIFIGLPSPYFMDWFFYYPDHCYKYAELSNHYYDYYTRHRESTNYNSISHSVNDWRSRNRAVVSADWDNDRSGRAQRFKEYGKMEMERTSYNVKNPKKQVDQVQYVEKERKKYPLLSEDVTKNQLNQKDPRANSIQGAIPEPVRKPPVPVPDQYKEPQSGRVSPKQPEQNIQQNTGNIQSNPGNKQPQHVNPAQQPDNNGSKQKPGNATYQPKNPVPEKQNENFNQIRNAQQYHENTWNQIQKQSQPARQPQLYSAPAPRQQENRQVQQPVKQNAQPQSNPRKK